jgi:hypothetical protein
VKLFGIWPLAGKEKTRVQPGQFKEQSMESALISQSYRRRPEVSTGARTSVVMTYDQARAAWMRRVIGIPADTDPRVYGATMPDYIVNNNIQIAEDHE